MFQFVHENSAALLAVTVMVALALVYRAREKRRRLEQLIERPLLAKLSLDPVAIGRCEAWRGVRVTTCVLLLTLAYLRPQWGYTWTSAQQRGVDIVVAIDVSASMNAEDVSPNRLERAKREIIDLVDRLRGDRIGLVAFAGVAFLQTPLTYDYAAFRTFLQLLNPELIPIPGTNIESALNESLEALTSQKTDADSEASSRGKAIILMTDGEEFAGDLNKFKAKAEKAGVRIFIYGVGTEEGAPIRGREGLKRERDGSVVLTKLEPKALGNLASATGGVYVRSIATEGDTETIYDRGIKALLGDRDTAESRTKKWNEYFQVPLLVAVILLLWGVWRDPA